MSTDQLLRKYEYRILSRASGQEAVWQHGPTGKVQTESEALLKIREWVKANAKRLAK